MKSLYFLWGLGKLLLALADDSSYNYQANAIHEAAMHGHVTALRRLLISDLYDVDAPDSHGASALHYAAMSGEAEAVTLLLAAGADPNNKNVNNETPLHYAALAEETAAIALLVKAGAGLAKKEIDAAGHTSTHPEHINCIRGDCTEGVGVGVYSDGSVHDGIWARGIRQGHGRFTRTDGTSIVGDWSDGVFVAPKVSTGSCTGNCKEGAGTWTFDPRGPYRGASYTGGWRNNLFEGRGVYTHGVGDGRIYDGEWTQGYRTGNGEIRRADGSLEYRGLWKDSQQHGRGVYFYPNGDSFDGEWSHGKLLGSGMYTFGSGGEVGVYAPSSFIPALEVMGHLLSSTAWFLAQVPGGLQWSHLIQAANETTAKLENAFVEIDESFGHLEAFSPLTEREDRAVIVLVTFLMIALLLLSLSPRLRLVVGMLGLLLYGFTIFDISIDSGIDFYIDTAVVSILLISGFIVIRLYPNIFRSRSATWFVADVLTFTLSRTYLPFLSIPMHMLCSTMKWVSITFRGAASSIVVIIVLGSFDTTYFCASHHLPIKSVSYFFDCGMSFEPIFVWKAAQNKTAFTLNAGVAIIAFFLCISTHGLTTCWNLSTLDKQTSKAVRENEAVEIEKKKKHAAENERNSFKDKAHTTRRKRGRACESPIRKVTARSKSPQSAAGLCLEKTTKDSEGAEEMRNNVTTSNKVKRSRTPARKRRS